MIDLSSESPSSRAISVSDLNRTAKRLLEDGLARLWVEGELSNLARPASGHVYFTLKDATAQVRCAYFRQRQRGPVINLKNGDQMLVFGKVSLYEARGDYQLIVEQMEEAGEGELRRRFEALKKKLAAEGLFDEERKSPLPRLPARIGVVTSPSGAAIRDILTVLGRRFPAIPVVVYPASVQGEAAAGQIADAIATAVRRAECDVLIVGRGGGSLEDLWPFNEERVARAIADCPIPVISAVGHEVDITIADFVADVRAPTPSGAAELVVPDREEWLRQLAAMAGRVANLGRRYLENRGQAVDWVARRLLQASPVATVRRQRDWLRNLGQILSGAIRFELTQRERRLATAGSALLRHSPALRVQRRIARLDALGNRLLLAGRKPVEGGRQRVELAARALDSVSPLATLQRGYAIVTDPATGRILTRAADTAAGESVVARLAEGSIEANVTKVEE